MARPDIETPKGVIHPYRDFLVKKLAEDYSARGLRVNIFPGAIRENKGRDPQIFLETVYHRFVEIYKKSPEINNPVKSEVTHLGRKYIVTEQVIEGEVEAVHKEYELVDKASVDESTLVLQAEVSVTGVVQGQKAKLTVRSYGSADKTGRLDAYEFTRADDTKHFIGHINWTPEYKEKVIRDLQLGEPLPRSAN